MKNLLLVVLTAGAFYGTLQAQQTAPRATLTGMVAAATDGRAAYLTFGGPGIKWSRSGTDVGLYMLPSLRMYADRPRPFVTPALGAGLFVRRKKMVAGIPAYYVAAQQRWYVAGALGIALGK
ncbi:MAG TPA: hypothetical protein PKE07_07350 [Lacibacter sp.]|nr:hypothetical protein [Lacibacter sp.]HMO88389.1 hypothetical protein [Lacibacter sp.]